MWSMQRTHENEGQNTADKPDVSTTCTSGVWKLDGIQWKLDTHNPNFVEGSMGMYHWET